MQNLLYFAETQWCIPKAGTGESGQQPEGQTNPHPLSLAFLSPHPTRPCVRLGHLPRVERIVGPSSTAAHLASMQLAVNHRVGSVSQEFRVRMPSCARSNSGHRTLPPSFLRTCSGASPQSCRRWNPYTNAALAIPHLRPGRRFQNPRRIPRVSSSSSSSLRRRHPSLVTTTRAASAAAVGARAI
ncbi:hypothetical protein B0H16DRAFT_129293 [Mycena metata]|uniref:Uncharacterized protein n=1 Tax=Mycena metata TaxID=1033252 RepID=A0AAD7I5L3_9AGAR|nr:hypothetical protein B0H16DRAFT_129293 [Mycena metata]